MTRKVKNILLSLTIFLISSGSGVGLYFILEPYVNRLSDYVQVYETTGTRSKLMLRETDITWKDYEFSGNVEVNVDAKQVMNDFQGAGVALTHASAFLLNEADEATKNEVLNDLFAETGARFNLVRIPIGTSDYTATEEFYSLDDIDEGTTDFELDHFSTARDEECLIPIIQDALAINPDIKFMAAPWSAPAWMKTNENLVGGNLKGYTGSVLAPEEEAYAAYLVKFIQAYATFGIDIDYLSLLNEPTISNVDYPSMQMGTNQYLRIAIQVVSLLKRDRLETKIMVYDHNVGSSSDITLFNQFAEAIEADDDLLERVSGYAFHGYGAQWSSLFPEVLEGNRNRMPSLDNYLTEITESRHSVDFATNLSWSNANVTIGPMSHGSSMAVYWNAVLSETGEPVLGNEPDCFGMITLEGNLIKKSASYYSFAHLSRFAYAIDGHETQRIDAFSDNDAKIKSVAFKRHDGTYVFVIANHDATTYEDVDLVFNGRSVTYRVQPESIITLMAAPARFETKPNESVTFERVAITQKSVGRYLVSLTLAETDPAFDFYLTTTDKFDVTKSIDEANQHDSIYEFDLPLVPGDYYLWASSGSRSGMLPLTIPKFNPQVQVDGSIAIISFNLDIATSWSSFCDPYGKSVYRSAKPHFDDTAEQVNATSTGIVDPIYILTESYTDAAYDETKPYYYIVMDGKNGLSRFISFPLMSDERLFSVTDVTLNLESGLPIMHLEAVMTGLTPAESFALVIEDTAGERHQVSNQANDALSFSFDARLLEKTGVWYDILIYDAETGTDYDVPIEAVSMNNITYLDLRFNFKDWAGNAKLNKDQLFYTQTEADLYVLENRPLLSVTGVKNLGATAELRLTYWDGLSTVTLASLPNESAVGNRFLFNVDLSVLEQPGVYYDLIIVIDDQASDLTSDMAVNITETITVGGYDYYFRTWEGLLKVVYDL
jgi:glucosylceramidase